MSWAYLWFAKPVLYWALFFGVGRWLVHGSFSPAVRAIPAALVRFIGGIALGYLLFLLLGFIAAGEAIIVVAFSLLRLLLWFGTIILFFRPISWRHALIVSFGATLLNWGIDWIVISDFVSNIRW